MSTTYQRLILQPQVACAAAATALAALAMGLATSYGVVTGPSAASAGVLIAAVVLAYLFPVYIRHNTKICLTSIPLYLMSVLLNPVLAAMATGVSILAGEFIVRRKRGTQLCDLITNGSRWVLLVFFAGGLAHVSMPGAGPVLHQLPLVLAAATLWAGDLLTLPLVLTPICGEHPRCVIINVAKDGGVAEAMQYVLGMSGAIAASYQPWAISMLAVPAVLIYLSFRKEVDEDTFQLLESMADTVDLRDPYTGGHSRRVADLAAGILDEMNMHGQEARLIKVAARVHDLGKVGLPDQLLIKAGALSPQEESIVMSYPDRGAELLAQYPDFSRGIEMVRHHHERWDGRGYPAGLAGPEIPFGARLIAVVDSFDAMTSDRPYRRALTVERAAAILRDGRGRQWDPDIVNTFLCTIGQPIDGDHSQSRVRELPLGAVAGRTLTA